MAAQNSSPILQTRFTPSQDETELPIWSCLITVESDTGLCDQLLASGMTWSDALAASRHAMDSRADAVGWSLRRDTERLN